MKTVFATFAQDEPVPVLEFLKDRKLVKYFSRETAAAIVCLGRLEMDLRMSPQEDPAIPPGLACAIPSGIPVYYATGVTEHEEYGLPAIARNSTDPAGKFSPGLFVRKGFSEVPPITQFKLLCNMPLCFLSLNYGLQGDNAVVYSMASALLLQALSAPVESPILLGAGKCRANGSVESGFAFVSKQEIGSSPFLSSSQEAVEIFRVWAEGSPR
jgi:hypothetical protein